MQPSSIPPRLLRRLKHQATLPDSTFTLQFVPCLTTIQAASVAHSCRRFHLGDVDFLDLKFQRVENQQNGNSSAVPQEIEMTQVILTLNGASGDRDSSESLGNYTGLPVALGVPLGAKSLRPGDILRYIFLRPTNDQLILARRNWLSSRFQASPGVVWVQDIPESVQLNDLHLDMNTPVGVVLFRSADINAGEALETQFNQRFSEPPLVSREEASKRTVAIITIGDNYGFSNYDLRKTLFNSAEGLNLRVVVVDRSDHWLNDEEAISASGIPENHRPFAFIPFDFTDLTTVDSRLTECLREWQASKNGVKLDGIYTFRDIISVAVSKVAIALGLPVPARPEALERCINKQKMRDLIPWNGQKACTISNRADIDAALKEGLQFPAIIKPRFGNGSLSVFKVVSAQELYEVWDGVTFPTGVAVVEPYIGGTEVDIDLILENGRLLYFDVTDNEPTVGDECEEYKEQATDRTFTETAMFIPTVLPEHIQYRLRDECYNAVLRVGLGQASGVFNVEARIGNSLEDLDGSIFIVEINIRCPGSNFPLLVQRAWGVDQYGCAFLAALGRPLSIACAPFDKPLAHGCVTWVPAKKRKTLARDPLEKVRGRRDLLSASGWPQGFNMEDGPDYIAKLYVISSEGREDCARRRRSLERQVVQVFEEDE